ncbi:MAG: hypothetical protein Q9M91_04355 [Candidatus Dojkabacteria bacterium]|nr:hypothetical protein [Candidatus Dojkabacteria bacterium]MDQ7021044.1 hypothetical protein [Candidatus Dojkabacteria bacterium]
MSGIEVIVEDSIFQNFSEVVGESDFLDKLTNKVRTISEEDGLVFEDGSLRVIDIGEGYRMSVEKVPIGPLTNKIVVSLSSIGYDEDDDNIAKAHKVNETIQFTSAPNSNEIKCRYVYSGEELDAVVI